MRRYERLSVAAGLILGSTTVLAGCGTESTSTGQEAPLESPAATPLATPPEKTAAVLVPCGTPSPTEAEARTVDRDFQVAANHVKRSNGPPVVIPVVFHGISSGPGIANGDLPDSMIQAQIAVLNQAFAGQIGGVATDFQFVLTQTTRTTNPSWFTIPQSSQIETDVKTALHQGGKSTLNIYTAQTTNNLGGWATLPWGIGAGNLYYDGAIINFAMLPGGSTPNYDRGYVAVHEVGHWLGLLHTFQGGCTKDNDFVSDTPLEKTNAFGCPTVRDTCPGGGTDPIHNFMDYSDNTCQTSFTTEIGRASCRERV